MKKETWFERHPVLKWIIIIILVFYITSYYDAHKEENCDLTFNTYTYNDGCASACSSKCYNEGFEYTSSSYFEPYLSYEEMVDRTLRKQCECNCGGCRE